MPLEYFKINSMKYLRLDHCRFFTSIPKDIGYLTPKRSSIIPAARLDTQQE
jgi:hypothetical protein